MSNPSAQRGFTLVELMVVVAITGVLLGAAAVSVGGPTGSISGETHAIAALAREANRKAVSAGPLRSDVAAAGTTHRTELALWTSDSGRLGVTVDVLKEQASPSTDVDKLGTAQHIVASGVTIIGVADEAHTEPGGEYEAFDGEAQVKCRPDGTCDAKTFFLETTGSRKRRTRLIIMPLTGMPIVFEGW